MKNELQKKLKELDPHLSCEVVTKEEAKATLNGDVLVLAQYSAGDVLVKYKDELFLAMQKIEDTPVIKLEVTYTDKRNSKLFANLIELCGNYLPDSKEKE